MLKVGPGGVAISAPSSSSQAGIGGIAIAGMSVYAYIRRIGAWVRRVVHRILARGGGFAISDSQPRIGGITIAGLGYLSLDQGCVFVLTRGKVDLQSREKI